MVASIPGQSFGTPIPNLPSIAMGDAVALRLVFQLGAGDSLDLTTAFVVQAVPAPGAVAMLAIAGLRARRRR
jgi:MYXO-CTERM domain-containing protein